MYILPYSQINVLSISIHNISFCVIKIDVVSNLGTSCDSLNIVSEHESTQAQYVIQLPHAKGKNKKRLLDSLACTKLQRLTLKG